ncbi:MAG: hypothetical protein ACRBBN_08095 [Methyloligellaceae bacterium]
MINERIDRRWKQLQREEEKKLGFVAIHAVGCIEGNNTPLNTNYRIVRIGYSSDPANNIKQGQSWNSKRFEILCMLWALDRAHAQRVYKELMKGLDHQKPLYEDTEELIGPWYRVPSAMGAFTDREVMEFSIKDAAAALGVNLLTESEYEVKVDGLIMRRLNRVLDGV